MFACDVGFFAAGWVDIQVRLDGSKRGLRLQKHGKDDVIAGTKKEAEVRRKGGKGRWELLGLWGDLGSRLWVVEV